MSQQQAEVGLQEQVEMSEKKTGLALLREPFPKNQISLLPKPKSKDSPKGRCEECGGWHGLPAVHLSYVGHAALTDRLLDADPEWHWEPLALDEKGLPVLDANGGLWIRLTVCKMTRMGYGDAQGKAGGDAMKERIGDALRNAAMRFGAALDLWHKGDLHPEDNPADEQPKPTPWTKELLDLAKEAVKDGMPGYTTFWKSLSDEARSVLVQTEEHKEFKAAAAKVKAAA